MKKILFQLRLGIALAAFFAFLGGEYLKQVKIPLFATALLVVMGGLIILNLAIDVGVSQENEAQLVAVSHSSSPDLKEVYYSQEDLDQQILALEQLLRLQPTHRDLLVNISFLYQAKMDTSRSQYYWQQARLQDPNSPLFTEQTISSL